jgi:hypothetical protein
MADAMWRESLTVADGKLQKGGLALRAESTLSPIRLQTSEHWPDELS